jgi:hypothetical protein
LVAKDSLIKQKTSLDFNESINERPEASAVVDDKFKAKHFFHPDGKEQDGNKNVNEHARSGITSDLDEIESDRVVSKKARKSQRKGRKKQLRKRIKELRAKNKNATVVNGSTTKVKQDYEEKKVTHVIDSC